MHRSKRFRATEVTCSILQAADLFRDDHGIENDAQRSVRKRSPRNDVVNPQTLQPWRFRDLRSYSARGHYGSFGRSRKGRVLDYTVPREDAHLADRLLICQPRSTFARLRRYRKSDSIPQDECAFPPSPQRLAPELSRPACASNRVAAERQGESVPEPRAVNIRRFRF
jgi:hypothetical protein